MMTMHARRTGWRDWPLIRRRYRFTMIKPGSLSAADHDLIAELRTRGWRIEVHYYEQP